MIDDSSVNAINDAGTIVVIGGDYAGSTLTGRPSFITGPPRPANVQAAAAAINATGDLLVVSMAGTGAPAFGSDWLAARGTLTNVRLPTTYASST